MAKLSVLSEANKKAFTTEMFKFVVGGDAENDGQAFYLHRGLVSRQSEPLARLMDSTFSKEAEDGFVKLEEIGVNTFARFCEFLYTGRYNGADPEDKAEPTKVVNSHETAPEDQAESTKVVNSHETAPEDPAESTKVVNSNDTAPEDAPEALKDPPSQKSDRGSQDGNSSDGDPWDPFGGKNAPASMRNFYGQLVKLEYRKLAKLTFSAPSTPVLDVTPVSDVDGSVDVPGDQTTRNYSPVFLCHAELYQFADRFQIQSLKELALHNLHGVLKAFKVGKQHVSSVLDLVDFVYSYTPEREGTIEDPLRRLVTMFVAESVEKLLLAQKFRAKLKEGGPFCLNLFLKTARRL